MCQWIWPRLMFHQFLPLFTQWPLTSGGTSPTVFARGLNKTFPNLSFLWCHGAEVHVSYSPGPAHELQLHAPAADKSCSRCSSSDHSRVVISEGPGRLFDCRWNLVKSSSSSSSRSTSHQQVRHLLLLWKVWENYVYFLLDDLKK